MALLWSFLILKLLMLLVRGSYHEISMKIFSLPDTSFGFSITYQSGIRRLIVSAPKGSKIGNVYYIDVEKMNMNITKMKDVHDLKIINRNKREYWFGATVKASSDFFVTCAPGFGELKYSDKTLTKKRESITSLCYVNHGKSFKELKGIPHSMRTQNISVLGEAMDSFGWSIEVTTNQKHVLIGGAAMSRGRVSLFRNIDSNDDPELIYKINYDNPVSYNFGYGLASGEFFSKDTVYAISTTYGETGRGKIYFFDQKLHNIASIEDDDVGTMFGAALCAATLEGKSLLVGIPLYTENKLTYDVGAVYVFAAQFPGSTQMTKKKVLKGFSEGSHFGHSIISLGDMDGDNNDEIAIAAPYEDNGKGAVYIYSGYGILEDKAPKKIQPREFSVFGYSLTIFQDSDTNVCNHLAIGAIGNNSVVLLKCMASIIVRLNSFVTITQKGENETNIDIQSCLKVKYPEKLQFVTADLIVKIEVIDRNCTIKDADENNVFTYTETIREKRKSICRIIKANNPSALREYAPLIAYRITATLENNPEEMEYDPSRVLLSDRSLLSIERHEWASECGENHTLCKPDLTMRFIFPIRKPYIIGSSESEQFSISIQNSGDTAYEACAIIKVHGASVLHSPSDCVISNNKDLICKVKNPLRKTELWNINNIILETKHLTSVQEYIRIECDLYEYCYNETGLHIYEENIELKGDSFNISITGVSNPGGVINLTPENIQKVRKEFEHIYTINNNGLTNWINLETMIILENVPYIEYTDMRIKIYKTKSITECMIGNTTEIHNTTTVFCNISDLWRDQKTTVVVSMNTVPKTLELDETTPKVAVKTMLKLLNGDKSLSVASILSLEIARVELWVIIVASIIGLLLVLLITFALYELRFLQRENKTKLKELRKDVYRQSVRRSMNSSSCGTAQMRDETKRLMDAAEEDITIDEKLQRQL